MTIESSANLLKENFKDPSEVESSSTITAARVVALLGSMAAAVAGLDAGPLRNVLEIVKPLIAGIPTDERGPIETALHKWMPTGADVDAFLESCGTPSAGPVFVPMSFSEMMLMPPKEWLVQDVIGVGDLVMLYGGSGSGKTHIAIDMIFSCLAGSQFAMRFDVARPLTVAYAAGEGISGLKSRFECVGDFYGGGAWPGLAFFRQVPQLFDSVGESVDQFIAEWSERQEAGQVGALDVLFIDTLHTASVGADENSARDSGVILAAAKRAVTALGCSVVLIHHTGKNGNGERGSSALRGAMDSMILIEKLSEYGTKAKMSCGKLKDGEQWKPQTFDLVQHLDSVRVWWDEPSEGGPGKGKEDEHGETMLVFMQSQPGKKLTAKVLAEVAGIGQPHAIKLLSKMVGDGLCSSELMDTLKPNSNRNPLTYFINSENAGHSLRSLNSPL